MVGQHQRDATTFITMTFGIMTLKIMTFSIMTLGTTSASIIIT
jgi:hypothetical protein